MNAIVRKAAVADIEFIHEIIKPYTIEGIVLERSIEEITQELNNFFVAENDKGEIVGVVSHHEYGKELKEIRSLVVKKKYSRKGIGRALISTLIERLLKDFPEAKIFALSYYPEFFKQFNFIEIQKDSLPEKIWKDCQNCKDKENCGETALVLSKS